MIKIIPKDKSNIHILVANGKDVVSLADIALKNRLYVSGWQMSYTLKEIRNTPRKATIALLYENDIPVSVCLQEKTSRVQSFTRKAKRLNGYGCMTFDCVIQYKNNEQFYHECGIMGSWSFFEKAKGRNKDFFQPLYSRVKMKGYKAFNQDLTCLDYQFVAGQKHVYEGKPILCKIGFHFCTEIQDCFNYYLLSDKPRVFEIEASGIITEPEADCSKRACSEITLIRELTYDEIKTMINSSQWAYWWALYIGDKEYMKQFVTDSYYAYHWARDIGDQEHMKHFVTDPEIAYCWARDIGDREHMKQFICDQKYAYVWAINIGDKEHMKQFITDSYYAYWWAKDIGDQEHMRQYITESIDALLWLRNINSGVKQYFKDKGII